MQRLYCRHSQLLVLHSQFFTLPQVPQSYRLLSLSSLKFIVESYRQQLLELPLGLLGNLNSIGIRDRKLDVVVVDQLGHDAGIDVLRHL